MNKLFTKIAGAVLGLTLTIGVGLGAGQHEPQAVHAAAEESVYKTALFGNVYNSKGVSSYTETWSATNDDFTVSLTNFNNNDNQWNYVKCGRKNTASVASISTTSIIDEPITSVDVTIDAITASKVNSIKLYTSTNGGSTWSEVSSGFTKATGVQSVTLTNPTENCLYKIQFDCAAGSSNGLVKVSKVEYKYVMSEEEASKKVTSVQLTGDMETKEYYEGFSWDFTGLSLEVAYDNGDHESTPFEDVDTEIYDVDPSFAENTDITEIYIYGVFEDHEFEKTIIDISVLEKNFDTLNKEFTGVTNSYTDWSDKSDLSNAVYAGHSAGGNNSIQLRTDSNNSGVITTVSGGILDKVVLIWNTATTEGRTVDIYGKNSPYSAASELYDASTQGTKLGSITYGSTTELVVTGDYAYFGLRSNTKALYLDEIRVYWKAAKSIIDFEEGITSKDVTILNGDTAEVEINVRNFEGAIASSSFTHTPSSSAVASLTYSVDGTVATVTINSLSVGAETFVISVAGVENTVSLNVNVQANTTFESLEITTPTTDLEFEQNAYFSVTDLVVTATYQVGGETQTEDFSGSRLSELTFLVGGVAVEIGDKLETAGELVVTISYTHELTGTTRTTTYSITVTTPTLDEVENDTFVKITNSTFLTTGEYLIVYETGSVAFDGGLETLDAAGNSIPVTISDSKIEANEDTKAATFTIDTVGGTSGTITSKSGNHIGQTSDANGLKSSTTTTYTNTFSFDDDGNFNVVSGGAYLRYNSASDQIRFRYYKSSSYTGQKAIQLYKLVEGTGSGVDADRNAVQEFVDTYLHMDDYTESKGWCNDAEHGYYLAAKAGYNELIHGVAERVDLFQNDAEFAEAKARYERWAEANNDADPYDGNNNVQSTIRNQLITLTENNNIAILIIVIASSMTLIAGVIVFKRKKNQLSK